MKNQKLLLGGAILIIVGSFTQCNSSEQDVAKKMENVVDANKELDDAQTKYIEDMAAFKEENKIKIAANEKSIADFKARIAAQKLDAKSDYNKRILELETKNSDFKKRLEDYKESSKEKWDAFKTEFNSDMIELNESLRDFTIDKK